MYCIAVCCSVLGIHICTVLQCVAVCCSVLQCVAVCEEAFINCRLLSCQCDDDFIYILYDIHFVCVYHMYIAKLLV